MKQQQVVTYRGAYIAREISLCHKHSTSEHARMSLGPVQHGLHRGRCAVCAEAEGEGGS